MTSDFYPLLYQQVRNLCFSWFILLFNCLKLIYSFKYQFSLPEIILPLGCCVTGLAKIFIFNLISPTSVAFWIYTITWLSSYVGLVNDLSACVIKIVHAVYKMYLWDKLQYICGCTSEYIMHDLFLHWCAMSLLLFNLRAGIFCSHDSSWFRGLLLPHP